MRADARGGAELLVERVADERVAEGERRRARGGGHEQSGGDGLVDGLQQRRGRHAQCVRHRAQPELAADDGGQAQQLARGVREPGGAAADGVADAVGQRQTGRRAVQRALALEQRDELAGEERVALGRRVQQLDELAAGVGRGARGEERGERLLVESAQGHAPPTGQQLPGQRPRLPRPQLRVADGGDDEHPVADHGAAEEPQRQQRRAVGPLQVVEDDDHRP